MVLRYFKFMAWLFKYPFLCRIFFASSFYLLPKLSSKFHNDQFGKCYLNYYINGDNNLTLYLYGANKVKRFKIEYIENGNYHREDGPAVIWSNGDNAWYVNGMYHRVDGPAVVLANGPKHWYINGVDITEEVNKWREEMGITNDELTPEESALFVLYFGNIK